MTSATAIKIKKEFGKNGYIVKVGDIPMYESETFNECLDWVEMVHGIDAVPSFRKMLRGKWRDQVTDNIQETDEAQVPEQDDDK